MSWMTKDLALDLLSILTGAAQSAYDRVKAAPGEGEWPQPEAQPQKEVAAAPQQQPETPAQPQPEATAPAAPAADDLINQAKTACQRIVAQDGSPAWITGTLFPEFGVQSLTDVPADKLPSLLEKANAHLEGGGAQ
ncbi:Uncharacterised protein [Corynebacterium imitans]|uniref:Uncharacterized protein n=1 Tax=Corynebacterium imitans TaxID=156978 RepID=A0A076NJ30_9CORY|nr:hypothetical protein [Corynebacterium imitans]AIJ33448.1 hypothetical protein CIMIT_05615 [Corynebacterium imitans]SNV70496.1 Uncharacterised protein [Corynebacterium imitans]